MLPSSTSISLPECHPKLDTHPIAVVNFWKVPFSGHYIPSHESHLRSETRCYHIVTWNEVVLNDNTNAEKKKQPPFLSRIYFMSMGHRKGSVIKNWTNYWKSHPRLCVFFVAAELRFCVGSMGFLVVLVDGIVASNTHRINLFWQ